MAARGKIFWTGETVQGPAGKYHVAVLRLMPGEHSLGRRDLYSATLYRRGDSGDESVESGFWQHTAPPHDSDKLAFREKARRSAQGNSRESSL